LQILRAMSDSTYLGLGLAKGWIAIYESGGLLLLTLRRPLRW
jgi:hypothetical protein